MDFKLIGGRQPPARVQQDVVELEEPEVCGGETTCGQQASLQPSPSSSTVLNCAFTVLNNSGLGTSGCSSYTPGPPLGGLACPGDTILVRTNLSLHSPGRTCAAGAPSPRAC